MSTSFESQLAGTSIYFRFQVFLKLVFYYFLFFLSSQWNLTDFLPGAEGRPFDLVNEERWPEIRARGHSFREVSVCLPGLSRRSKNSSANPHWQTFRTRPASRLFWAKKKDRDGTVCLDHIPTTVPKWSRGPWWPVPWSSGWGGLGRQRCSNTGASAMFWL